MEGASVFNTLLVWAQEMDYMSALPEIQLQCIYEREICFAPVLSQEQKAQEVFGKWGTHLHVSV